jgi:hypothetical protein
MRRAGHPASYVQVRDGTAMARYLSFLVVGCAFTFCAVAMAKAHLHVSNSAPHVVAYQNAR